MQERISSLFRAKKRFFTFLLLSENAFAAIATGIIFLAVRQGSSASCSASGYITNNVIIQ